MKKENNRAMNEETRKPAYRHQEIESEMIEVIQKFLAWGGIETSVKMFFDLFEGIKYDEYDSETIYDIAWESMRTLLALTRLYQLNEQRVAAVSDLKNKP